MDEIERAKEGAKAMFAGFAVMETLTGVAAPRLVRFAGIGPGDRVLDVACGTGVVALTAARQGAEVTGLDLTPELVVHARENARIMGLEANFDEGDAETLPYDDGTFDVVVSQFGHMFAPRPEVATREMLRVLRPGGTIAFSTWPPELYLGQWLELAARYAPHPEAVASPTLWGEPRVVRERLGNAVRGLTFDRDVIFVPVLSPQHALHFSEQGPGPLAQTIKRLEKEAPQELDALRREVETLISTYFEDNRIRQDFLMSRATKV